MPALRPAALPVLLVARGDAGGPAAPPATSNLATTAPANALDVSSGGAARGTTAVEPGRTGPGDGAGKRCAPRDRVLPGRLVRRRRPRARPRLRDDASQRTRGFNLAD